MFGTKSSMNNKFLFEIKNLKLLYDNLKKQDYNSERILYKFDKSSNFIFPISDFSVYIEKALGGDLSILAVIKKDIYAENSNQKHFFDIPVEVIQNKYKLQKNNDYFSILDESESERLFIRNIENFGIYFFTGRPDLSLNSFNCSKIENNFEGFVSTIEFFRQTIELTINHIYSEIYLPESIKVIIEPVELETKILKNTKETTLPGALKRFYDKIGVSY